MNKFDRTELYSFLIKRGYFTRKELELITDLLPNTTETLAKAIYSRFGVDSVERFIKEMGE